MGWGKGAANVLRLTGQVVKDAGCMVLAVLATAGHVRTRHHGEHAVAQQGRHVIGVPSPHIPLSHLLLLLLQEDPRHRRAYLSNVCVAPAARRLGVARALLRLAEEEARRKGAELVLVAERVGTPLTQRAVGCSRTPPALLAHRPLPPA